MQKFQGLILTVVLSFFTHFVCTLEGEVTINNYTPTHELHDNDGLNTAAITIDASHEISLNFDEQRQLHTTEHFFSNPSIHKLYLNISLSYLKICDFFNFSQTIGTIIFPFHSFL
ncbi:hypothetical protein APS56_10255 [Pseudalgibacter alginicilyticus]|uniref:Uncharacterized protein n=1 Tax=Pseudalgibacter alginicilyticus TaxID=1736674 RepID=A0A0P0D5T3_9FLAO|nr:hypothetical protein [Pseudalgibacter alginicilyticus]ALJ05476.1 hypothetical protein APS56_10255 [Pseudalgibacter alginicilyticus]